MQHLQLFTEYGRLALEDSGETPFQKLQVSKIDPYKSLKPAEMQKLDRLTF